MQIIKQILDVDFGIIESADEEKIKIKTVHGDVLIVSGMIEDEPDSLITLGIVNGENYARIAFYKPMDEIVQMVREKE